MDEALDRISSLPDDVLTHILSFASAKEVVQTCILSKRWRNIWASVPVLEFRLDEFLENYSRTKEDDDPKNELHAKNLKFDRFVVGVLNNRGQSWLDTIMYHWDYVSFSCEPSMKWLDHAVLLKPTVIRVCIGNLLQLDEFNIPDSVFLCESLQNLELSIRTNGTTIIKPKSISLPSLGTMKLKGLCLDDDFAQNLFLGCPSLESLNLEICQIDIPEISSNVLKKLTLDECWQVQHMRICCPCLVSLFISSSMNSIRVISLVNMASLVNAEIDLYGSDGEEDIVDLPDLSILCGLSNATRLKLTLERDLKEQWKKDIRKCSVFKNLKSLEIGSWNINDDYDLVACFLEHSPVLQELSFHLFYCDVADAQEEPRQRSFFQLKYLDMVKIICGKNENLASKLIILLGRHVMTIGNVIIT